MVTVMVKVMVKVNPNSKPRKFATHSTFTIKMRNKLFGCSY